LNSDDREFKLTIALQGQEKEVEVIKLITKDSIDVSYTSIVDKRNGAYVDCRRTC